MASITKRLDFLKNTWHLLLPLSLYLLFVLVLNPVGNFAVNDDWIFVRQVEAFTKGNFTISALIDPSFIAQGILGFVWALVFGLSFTSLRILTVLCTLFAAYALFLNLQELKINKYLTLVSLLAFLFNPLILHLSMSFMTDIYFLLFILLSSFFYLKSLKDVDNRFTKFVLLGSFFGALSLLIRQPGIVLIVSFTAVSLCEFLSKRWDRKRLLISLFISWMIFGIGFMVYIFWPKYSDVSAGGTTALTSLLQSLISPESFSDRLLKMFWSIYYLALFTSPLVFTAFTKFSLKNKFAVFGTLTFLIIVSRYLFRLDLFPIGNVLYLEGLNIKTSFRSNLSMFDNIFFKTWLAAIGAVSLAGLGFLLASSIKKVLKTELVFIFLTALGFYLVLFFGNDYYDRYLLPAFSILLIGISNLTLSGGGRKLFAVSALATTLLIAVFLQTGDFNKTRIKWELADNISKSRNIYSQTYLSGNYFKYIVDLESGNYTGITSAEVQENYKCFVLDYTEDSNSWVNKNSLLLQDLALRVLENPRAPQTKKRDGIPNIKNNKDKVIEVREYFSPMYNLLGKKAFVGSFCTD